jgi:hypothetical protein
LERLDQAIKAEAVFVRGVAARDNSGCRALARRVNFVGSPF